MRQLVSHHRADGAIIHCVVHAFVVEGRLQDAGRKIDVIFGGIVIGIYGGRCHQPFRAIRRLANLVQDPMNFEFGGALVVAHHVSAHDLKA